MLKRYRAIAIRIVTFDYLEFRTRIEGRGQLPVTG